MMQRTCRIPGKLMLAGEYSVLRGHPAIAATVDLHLETTFWADGEPGQTHVTASSEFWPPERNERKIRRNEDSDDPLADAVTFAMEFYGIKAGRLTVNKALEPKFGLGSSSALRLGVLLAMAGQANDDPWSAAELAMELQKKAQGQASGYDIATQCQGGLVRYHKRTNQASLRAGTSSYSASTFDVLKRHGQIYVGGSGAPTGPIMERTLAWLDQERGRTHALDQLNLSLVQALEDFLASPDAENWQKLASGFEAHHNFFESTPDFPKALKVCRSEDGYGRDWIVKPTGAGGEDAFFLMTREPHQGVERPELKSMGLQLLPYSFCATGVQCHIN